MKEYIHQLLSDIAQAKANASFPYVEKDPDIMGWFSESEAQSVPERGLEEWTGIRQEQLPPAEMLSDEQISQLLAGLKEMLEEYNCSVVVQFEVPERIQYAAVRANFNQFVKVRTWHMGFFEFCRPGTEHGTCELGSYCHCAFFEELTSGFVDEELDLKEEREEDLMIEIDLLRRKYGRDWLKYYPYHLDANYDDEFGNPLDYGFGEGEE